jgi:flagellar motor switch protein FliM
MQPSMQLYILLIKLQLSSCFHMNLGQVLATEDHHQVHMIIFVNVYIVL